MTGLRGRAGIAGAALIMMAGLAIPAATSTPATAAATAPVQGTDVSNLTTVTSWPDVKAAGMTFVGIEAIQGKSVPNTQYNSQVTGATSAGLYVMPYIYADPGKWAGATQFGYGWSVINGVPGAPYTLGGQMLPIVLDMESDPINFPNEPCYGLTQSQMQAWIQAFAAADVVQTGANPIIYSNPDWWASCVGTPNPVSRDPLWIANYGVSSPAIPSGWGNYAFWQSSNTATINGISGAGNADLDYFGPVTQVSSLNKAISPFQLYTFGSLQGQTVSYSSATGLPPSLMMSSSGQITGTPTTPGRYAVTVTPSAGVPSTISFIWIVHGTLTVNSPGNQTTTAGSPVWLHVTDTDQDGSSFPPSLAVSGLPPGLSMSSGGVISGWPFRPGTYSVTVSASDGVDASGSATFTWTVNAAPDSGGTGTLRQWGGSNKCLNDAGAKTTNGNAVNLWTCTGGSDQNWTMAADGTIRTLGKCLDAVGAGTANGTQLQLWSCNSGDGRMQWRVGSDSQLVNPQSGKCLYVPVASAANGTRPQLFTCANSTTQANEHWLRPAASVYSGDVGKCLAVSGSTVVLSNCANLNSQHWTQKWDGTVRLGTNCLTQTSTGLSIGACSGAAATKWQLNGIGTLPIGTEIVNAGSGKCVTAPSAANGVKLVVGTCAANDAETWHVE